MAFEINNFPDNRLDALRLFSCLLLLSAQLVLVALYASLLLCIWLQFRALNNSSMAAGCDTLLSVAADDNDDDDDEADNNRVERWPRLHDALTDAVRTISKCYSFPVCIPAMIWDRSLGI